PAGYLEGVRELTARYGIVFIADEVMAGFGRTGRWFAVDHWDVTPDLITFAKGVNSGYVPLGGVAISDAIFETFRDRAYPGGLTYSGIRWPARRRWRRSPRWRPRAWSTTPTASAPRASVRRCGNSRSATPRSGMCAAWGASGRSNSSRTGRRRNRWPPTVAAHRR